MIDDYEQFQEDLQDLFAEYGMQFLQANIQMERAVHQAERMIGGPRTFRTAGPAHIELELHVRMAPDSGTSINEEDVGTMEWS